MVTKKRFLIVPFVYILITFFLIFALDQETTNFLTAEDHFFEYATTAGFLIASILCVLIFVRLQRTKSAVPFLQKLSFLALAGIFFFGAGEEISWGQRIFNISTPEAIMALNEQSETTIHNLTFFQGENEIFIDFSSLFSLFWFGLTVFIPLTALLSSKIKQFYEKFVPVFPWAFGFLFIFNWAVAKLGGYILRSGLPVTYNIQNMVETKESNFGVLFAILLFYTYVVLVRRQFGGDSEKSILSAISE